MFKILFSNLKMMINTSTFSKGLIIFLVYYLEIVLVLSNNNENTGMSLYYDAIDTIIVLNNIIYNNI